MFVSTFEQRALVLTDLGVDVTALGPKWADACEALSSAVKQRKLPVRILWGTGDTIFSPASPDYLDKVFPNSRGVRRIEGAKLFFPEEFPREVAAEALKLTPEDLTEPKHDGDPNAEVALNEEDSVVVSDD